MKNTVVFNDSNEFAYLLGFNDYLVAYRATYYNSYLTFDVKYEPSNFIYCAYQGMIQCSK